MSQVSLVVQEDGILLILQARVHGQLQCFIQGVVWQNIINERETLWQFRFCVKQATFTSLNTWISYCSCSELIERHLKNKGGQWFLGNILPQVTSLQRRCNYHMSNIDTPNKHMAEYAGWNACRDAAVTVNSTSTYWREFFRRPSRAGSWQ